MKRFFALCLVIALPALDARAAVRVPDRLVQVQDSARLRELEVQLRQQRVLLEQLQRELAALRQGSAVERRATELRAAELAAVRERDIATRRTAEMRAAELAVRERSVAARRDAEMRVAELAAVQSRQADNVRALVERTRAEQVASARQADTARVARERLAAELAAQSRASAAAIAQLRERLARQAGASDSLARSAEAMALLRERVQRQATGSDSLAREIERVRAELERLLQLQRARLDTLRRDTLAARRAPVREMLAPERRVERPPAAFLVEELAPIAPRAAWAPQDPADSLYRAAVASLTRNDYRRAVDQFSQIESRYPTSVYVADAHYYKAMALYRMGGQSELREAVGALDAVAAMSRERSVQSDVSTLRARVLAALAAHGDGDARERVAELARRGGETCERDAVATKLEALASVTRNNPAAASTELRAVLARRDECLAVMRQSALLLVSRLPANEQLEILGEVVRNDPAFPVQQQALEFVGRLPQERTIALQAELIRSTRPAALQDQVVEQLAGAEEAVARNLLREAIESPHLAPSTRAAAVEALRRSDIAEDVAYVTDVERRLDSASKEALASLQARTIEQYITRRPDVQIMNARAARLDSIERIAVESSRALAATLDAQQLAQAIQTYDATDSRPKLEAVTVLAAASGDAATDKLVAIARDTRAADQVRQAAIKALAGKSDARSVRMLLELIRDR